MTSSHYILRIGPSADGKTLHPSEADPEEGFRFTTLEESQRRAEKLSGRRLYWRCPIEGTWVAAVGDGRVVDITRVAAGPGPTTIAVTIGLMD